MRATLLGGSGFLGLSIAQHLRGRGCDVTVVDRGDRLARNRDGLASYRTRSLDDGELRPGDLTGQDVLIYLASATLPSTSMESLSRDAEANITPALRAFERAADAQVPRIVFASSGGTVYGIAHTLPIDENHPNAPISAYGVSKLAIEHYLSVMARGHCVRGISLRVSNPYGPYQFRGVGVGALARFLSCVRAGEEIEIWGDGAIVRDYIHVDDVARAFVAACTTEGLPSGEYNVGSGEGISLNGMIQQIAELCHEAAVVRYRPSRTFDVPEVVLDCGKFRDATGWRPDVSFPEGLKRMWAHLQNAYPEGGRNQ